MVLIWNGYHSWVGGLLGGLARDCPQGTLEFATAFRNNQKKGVRNPHPSEKTHSNQISSNEPGWDLFPCYNVLKTGSPLGLLTKALSCQFRVGKNCTGQALRSGDILPRDLGYFWESDGNRDIPQNVFQQTGCMWVKKGLILQRVPLTSSFPRG